MMEKIRVLKTNIPNSNSNTLPVVSDESLPMYAASEKIATSTTVTLEPATIVANRQIFIVAPNFWANPPPERMARREPNGAAGGRLG